MVLRLGALIENWSSAKVVESFFSAKVSFSELRREELVGFELSFELIPLGFDLPDFLHEHRVVKGPAQSFQDKLPGFGERVGFLNFTLDGSLVALDFLSQGLGDVCDLGLVLSEHVLESLLHLALDHVGFPLHFPHLLFNFGNAFFNNFGV